MFLQFCDACRTEITLHLCLLVSPQVFADYLRNATTFSSSLWTMRVKRPRVLRDFSQHRHGFNQLREKNGKLFIFQGIVG